MLKLRLSRFKKEETLIGCDLRPYEKLTSYKNEDQCFFLLGEVDLKGVVAVSINQFLLFKPKTFSQEVTTIII